MKARIIDQINLASKLTPSKVLNSFKLLFSYYWSRATKKAIQWGYPASISFEPTTSCNLRCPSCRKNLIQYGEKTQPDKYKQTLMINKRLLIKAQVVAIANAKQE